MLKIYRKVTLYPSQTNQTSPSLPPKTIPNQLKIFFHPQAHCLIYNLTKPFLIGPKMPKKLKVFIQPKIISKKYCPVHQTKHIKDRCLTHRHQNLKISPKMYYHLLLPQKMKKLTRNPKYNLEQIRPTVLIQT